MKFTKKLSLFIMFLVIGTFFSKNFYSKEKSSNSYYEYTTEKIKIYSDENKKENIGTLIKGTRVNVFVTKEIIKKSKDKNGKEYKIWNIPAKKFSPSTYFRTPKDNVDLYIKELREYLNLEEENIEDRSISTINYISDLRMIRKIILEYKRKGEEEWNF